MKAGSICTEDVYVLLQYLGMVDAGRFFVLTNRASPIMLKFMQERIVFEEIGELFRVTLRFGL